MLPVLTVFIIFLPDTATSAAARDHYMSAPSSEARRSETTSPCFMKKTEKGLRGHPLKLVRCESPAGHIPLPWHKVGVYETVGVDTDITVNFKMKDVVGKAMMCGDIVSTWKPQWIMSKKNQ